MLTEYQCAVNCSYLYTEIRLEENISVSLGICFLEIIGWFIESVCYITRDDLQLRRDFHSLFAKITARKLHNAMFSCKIYSVGEKEFALGFFLITEKIKYFYTMI